MKELFEKYSLELEKDELEKFEKFLEIFIEKNSGINLSAIREPDDIIEKHFIDSLLLNIFVELDGQVADLGTGGGFPLIPLAITNPETEFTGIDSVAKKMKVVNEFIDTLEIPNAHAIAARFEDAGQDDAYRASFDFVVSRATAFLPVLLEYSIPLLKVGGVLCAYKLDDKEELKSSKKALSKLGAKIMKVKNYTIGDQKRVIIFIEKIADTHKAYPRKNGIPSQSPIQ
ncbi:16S rRNA (guanine(527)-N(7))-methyltransferase RsmG [Candidatus Gracilibacteria bacterium]|nr:16S rRNA (guanine(527)-N(7))-methyltransferase RsmG [Candidatus Gracilibacteria bacterium]